MAQECGFFNAQLIGEDEYDRVYLAEQFAAYFASFIGNGVFGSSMQKLEVSAQNVPDMSVKVLPGEGWINGWWYRNTEAYTLFLDVADGVLNRIDVIVLRWGNQERNMWLHVIKGEASSNPVAPAIRRDADYFDLQLATVYVARGAIKITQAQITDTRLDNSVCGLVTGVVDQIDTTDLYNQFEAYFEQFKAKYEKDYADWTEEQKQAYLTWVAEQKGLYDAYIASTQKDYDDWTAEKKTEWAQWVTNQENEFTEWVAEQMAAYNLYITTQENAFKNWYDINTAQWTQDFTTWFDNIKGQLSGDIATSLQNQLNELQAQQPVDLVAEIQHNRDAYIHCDLFETTYACGVQGAGEGPAGGASLISSQVEYEMPDRNNIKVKAKAGLGTLDMVAKLSDDMYSVVFENKVKSLVVVLKGGTIPTENENEESEVK